MTAIGVDSSRLWAHRRTRRGRAGTFGLVFGGATLATLVLGAFLVPLIMGSASVARPSEAGLSPSPEHLFGTDRYGRDVFVRTFTAARIDVSLAAIVTVTGLVVGSVVGAVSASLGGWFDLVVMRVTDMLMAFPAFALALIITASLGNSATNAAIGVTIAYIPQFIRLTRSQALQVRNSDFVAAARVSGTGKVTIALQHVLPNSFRAPLAQASLIAGWAVLDIAGLSFLGVGVQPPSAEWGAMIAEGAGDVLLGDWWTAFFPGLMILLVAASFQTIGNRLERMLR